jgi:hypothetical protein
MYVKSLVGRAAGSVIDLPKLAADSAILNGTHEVATEDEIMAAGYKTTPVQTDSAPTTLPEGFKVVRYPGGGGFELRFENDKPAADELFPNMIAAYEAAAGMAGKDKPAEVPSAVEDIVPDEEAAKIAAEDLAKAEAAAKKSGKR